MQKDLEDREREAKRRKFDVEDEEMVFKREVEKLKEESERLKRERDKKLQEDLMREEVENESERTIKVRFRKDVDRSLLSADMIEEMFSRYGEVENVLLRKSALVVFETVLGAKAALSKVMKSDDPTVSIIKEVTMAENKSNGNAPSDKDQTETINGPLTPSIPQPISTAKPVPSTAPKFSFKPTADTGNGADYESITLLRMRKLEKERLEREIREREEKEEREIDTEAS